MINLLYKVEPCNNYKDIRQKANYTDTEQENRKLIAVIDIVTLKTERH